MTVRVHDLVAWRAHRNRYWPSQYLLDGAGRVRYRHIGEGSYGRTEDAIRELLAEPANSSPRIV